MAFEIGYNQKEVLTLELNKTLPSVSFEFLKDINGKDRMLFVYFDQFLLESIILLIILYLLDVSF